RDRPSRRCAETPYVTQAEAKMMLRRFHRAIPLGYVYISRQHAEPVALRIFDQYGRMIKTHGLIVEQGACERSQIVTFEIRAPIGQQREARGVRFGEPVER